MVKSVQKAGMVKPMVENVDQNII